MRDKELQPVFGSRGAASSQTNTFLFQNSDIPAATGSHFAMSSECSEEMPFIDTVEGEISFYRSMMRARPIGIHAQFHVLAIRNAILKDTGQTVSTDDIWAKLKSMYDLDALEGLVSALFVRGP